MMMGDGLKQERGIRVEQRPGFEVLLELDHAPFGCVMMVNMINTAKSCANGFQGTDKFCLLKK